MTDRPIRCPDCARPFRRPADLGQHRARNPGPHADRRHPTLAPDGLHAWCESCGYAHPIDDPDCIDASPEPAPLEVPDPFDPDDWGDQRRSLTPAEGRELLAAARRGRSLEPKPGRWAFLNTETGDWIEVKPGVVWGLASPEPAPLDVDRLARAMGRHARHHARDLFHHLCGDDCAAAIAREYERTEP